MDQDQEKGVLDVEEVERKKTQSTDTVEDDVSEEEGKRIIWRIE